MQSQTLNETLTFLEWLERQQDREGLVGAIARDVQAEIKRIGRPLTHLNERRHFIWHCYGMPVAPKVTREQAIAVFTEYLRECVWPRLDEEREQREQKQAQKPAPAVALALRKIPTLRRPKLEATTDNTSGAIKVEGLSFTAIITGHGDTTIYWRGTTPPAVTLKQEKPNA